MVYAYVFAICLFRSLGEQDMLDKISEEFKFQQRDLNLRSYRSSVIASNIANADTPYYKAVDFDFRDAMLAAEGKGTLPTPPLTTTDPRHFGASKTLQMAATDPRHFGHTTGSTLDAVTMQYRSAIQQSLDGNTVDMNKERSAFIDNALKYQSTLTFLNKRMASVAYAINGG